MQFIIANNIRQGVYSLKVFNCGFQIATHVSKSKSYLRGVIKGYQSDMATNPDHAAHGHDVHVIWAEPVRNPYHEVVLSQAV